MPSERAAGELVTLAGPLSPWTEQLWQLCTLRAGLRHHQGRWTFVTDTTSDETH